MWIDTNKYLDFVTYIMNFQMLLFLYYVSNLFIQLSFKLNTGFDTNNTPFLLQNLLLQNHKHVIW